MPRDVLLYVHTGTEHLLLRRTIVIRTHDIHKNLYITLFWLTKFGPEYYVPP